MKYVSILIERRTLYLIQGNPGAQIGCYLLFNSVQDCLYVGSTRLGVMTRIKKHMQTKDWFANARYVGIEEFASIDEAIRREIELHHQMMPIHAGTHKTSRFYNNNEISVGSICSCGWSGL